MRYLRFLFSGAFMGILLILFAAAIGYATFVENDYDAVTAKMVVYNAKWFEALMGLMVVNFAGMIFTYKLYVLKKLNILIIHLAFVFIIIGAAITRYIGLEGQMHIRNGQTIDQFLSADEYLKVRLEKDGAIKEIEGKVMFSSKKENLYSASVDFEGKPYQISVQKYLPNAVQTVVPVNMGVPYIKMVVGSQAGRHETYIKHGEQRDLYGTIFSFGDTVIAGQVNIILQDSQLFVNAPDTLTTSPMDGSQKQIFEANKTVPVKLMNVHSMGNSPFVITEFIENGFMNYTQATDEKQQGIPIIKMEINNMIMRIPKGVEKTRDIEGTKATVYVGSKLLDLPFALHLNQFEMERYPGSNSPSSYASHVTVVDDELRETFDFKIFMNNILNYRGYRFFQSSYDQDEQGTILSVNHDFWGTLVTYFGYALLFGSLIASFFTRNNRFASLTQQLKTIHLQRKKTMASIAVLGLIIAFTNQAIGNNILDGYIDKVHAESFGTLLTQDIEGRIEPVNTAAAKVLMKIYKKTTFNGLSADQIFLGFVSDPDKWRSEPIIKVSDPALRSILGMLEDHARFSDFIDKNGKYKIMEYVDLAYQKKPALRSTFDKEIINVDERANVMYKALNGDFINIFPLQNDPNNKWITPPEFHRLSGHGTPDGDMFEHYMLALNDAKVTGDYSDAASLLEIIRNYQQENGNEIIPSETKIKLELFYNKANIFQRLFPFYLTVGLILVVLFFLQIFNVSLQFRLVGKVLVAILLAAFLFHTYGLGLRWYLSGHAPWSNGYESMIYISWATMLAGFLFMKRSRVTLAITSVLAGITLLTAHMSWMNPEITNLVPVLKSHWLTIHVATITGSYGFLGLGCLMGFLNMLLMIFRNKQNELQVNLMLHELTLIVEISLIVGLVLLIIGNFLGGIWANESWGRYWGWDPKESWTLVSVIVYSFVLHLKLIPSLRSNFSFNLLAVLSFGCVLMTYFGVNYYLTGLHSYANGDPVPIPTFVYYTLAVIASVAVLAGLKEHSHRSLNEQTLQKKPLII